MVSDGFTMVYTIKRMQCRCEQMFSKCYNATSECTMFPSKHIASQLLCFKNTSGTVSNAHPCIVHRYSHPIPLPRLAAWDAKPSQKRPVPRPWDGTPNSAQLGPVLGRNQRILYTDRHRPRFMAPSNATMTLVPNAVKLSAVVAAQYPTAPCSVKHIHEST